MKHRDQESEGEKDEQALMNKVAREINRSGRKGDQSGGKESGPIPQGAAQ